MARRVFPVCSRFDLFQGLFPHLGRMKNLAVARGSVFMNMTRPLVVEAEHPRRSIRLQAAKDLGASVLPRMALSIMLARSLIYPGGLRWVGSLSPRAQSKGSHRLLCLFGCLILARLPMHARSSLNMKTTEVPWLHRNECLVLYQVVELRGRSVMMKKARHTSLLTPLQSSWYW